MQIVSNAQSRRIRSQSALPVLRPAMLCSDDGFVGVLNFAASLPHRAPLIVEELERYSRSYVLDATLQSILRKARGTTRKRRSH